MSVERRIRQDQTPGVRGRMRVEENKQQPKNVLLKKYYAMLDFSKGDLQNIKMVHFQKKLWFIVIIFKGLVQFFRKKSTIGSLIFPTVNSFPGKLTGHSVFRFDNTDSVIIDTNRVRLSEQFP